MSDEEAEEVDHPNVADDDLIDDIDYYIRENDIDDDVDMSLSLILILNKILIQRLRWMKKKMNDI